MHDGGNILEERKESNMKKYEKPIVEIVEFDNLDVIVMSENACLLYTSSFCTSVQ